MKVMHAPLRPAEVGKQTAGPGDSPGATEGPVPPAVPVLSLRERLAYGVGDFASDLYWQTFMVYLTYFYTDVFGLSALATGAMLGISRSLDALFDPVMGALADRTATRWGKFRPYLLWLSPPLAVVGVLTFTVPDLPSGARTVWAWVTFNALMLLYTGINIPYTALLAVLHPNPSERTALASIKFVFAFAAALLVTSAVLPLSRLLGAGDAALGWQRCFMLVGALATAAYLIVFFHTRERVQPPRRQVMNLRRDLRDLFRNGPMLLLTSFSLLFSLAQAVRGGAGVHYFKYYVGAATVTLPEFLPEIGGTHTWQFEELSAAFSFSAGLAALGGVLLMPAVARAVGRKPTFIAAFALAIASMLGFYFLRPDQIQLMFALTLLGTFVGAPLGPLLWAMYADTVDYAEWKTERRATGLVFATVLFAGKQGWALGSILSLSLMSWSGFVANAAQTPESLRGLVLLVSVVPAALFAVALVVVCFYPLGDARMAEITRALELRRAGASPTP